MKKPNETVKKETVYIAVWVVIFSVMMEGIFLIIGKWDGTVLFGNLLGAVFAVLNFLLMGITVQAAVSKEEKSAATTIKFSQSLRFFMLFVVAGIGILAPVFSAPAVIIPLFFPRAAIFIKSFCQKKSAAKGGERE